MLSGCSDRFAVYFASLEVMPFLFSPSSSLSVATFDESPGRIRIYDD